MAGDDTDEAHPDDVVTLKRIIESLDRALAMADLSEHERLRAAVGRAKAYAEALLRETPSAERH